MALRTTDISPAQVARIEATFDLADREAVRRYINQHPFLVSLLIEAGQIIPRYFSSDTSIHLELIRDREDETREDLFAIIRTPLAVDDAVDCLDRLDAEWWLDAAHRARSKLTLDVESV